MKLRICSLLLIVALIPAFLAVPAYAAEEDFLFVDLMGYGGLKSVSPLNDTSTGKLRSSVEWRADISGNVRFAFNLPAYEPAPTYIDFVIAFSQKIPSTVSFRANGTTLNYQVFGASSDFVRVWGTFADWDGLWFDIISAPACTVGFISANVSYTDAPFHLSPSYSYSGPDGSGKTWTDATSDGYVFSNSTQGNFQFWISYSDWQLYDYITFEFVVSAPSINSIIATSSSQSFPVSVDFVENDSVYPGATFIARCCIDLTNCFRDDELLEVCVSGTLYQNESYYVRALNHLGFVKTSIASAELTWLQKIFSALSSLSSNLNTWIITQTQAIVDAIYGNSESPPDISAADDLVNQGQQIQDFEAEHQEVVNDNIDAITDSLDLTGFAPAMNLISSYVGEVFGVLGPYQQVFILPISLGIIFFICSRAPGIQVPREKVISPGVKIYRRSSKEVSS